MVVTLMLVGVGCFMAGFGIAIILCAAKKGAEIEKKIRINKNYDCVNNLEKKRNSL